MKNKKVIVGGGGGFIGSHLADKLIEDGNEVVIIDNMLTGGMENVNKKAKFYQADVRDLDVLKIIYSVERPQYVFNLQAVARTQWCIDDPIMATEINTMGTLNMLLCARDFGVNKFVHSSSCIVYVETTPYWVTKLAAENYVKVFNDLYKLPTIALRYSNVYGSLRQSEKGPAINVLASLRKTKREEGKLRITGDGEQSRDFIHVDDVVRANLIAAESDKSGAYDICTGKQTTLNTIARMFDCPIEYIEERQGDIKALVQDPTRAREELGFVYEKELLDNIQVYL